MTQETCMLPKTAAITPLQTFSAFVAACSGRRHRLRTLPGRLGYGLLRSGEEGMTPAELRALPIVIHERRHHRHLSDPAFNDLLVTPASGRSANMNVFTDLDVGLPEPFKGCPSWYTSGGTTATTATRPSITSW